MPTPEGQLTTSQLWSEKSDDVSIELAEAVLKLDDEELVEVLEIEQADDLPEL